MTTQIITFKEDAFHFIWRLLLPGSVVISSFFNAQVYIGNMMTRSIIFMGFSFLENKNNIHHVTIQNSGTKSKAFMMFLLYANGRSINLEKALLKRDKPFENIPVKRTLFLPRSPPYIN